MAHCGYILTWIMQEATRLFFYHGSSLLEKGHWKLCVVSLMAPWNHAFLYVFQAILVVLYSKWCFNDPFCILSSWVYIHVVYHVHITCRQGTLGGRNRVTL